MIQVVPMQNKHLRRWHQALDEVAREEKYLFILKAPPFKKLVQFYRQGRKKGSFFVALEQGKVVGWCDIKPTGRPTMDHVGVLGMGVRRGFRGKGVGTCLLRETLKNAKDNGFEIVQLDVYGSNKPAIRIYKKSGFKVEGIRKRSRKHRGRYEDLVMMSKRFK